MSEHMERLESRQLMSAVAGPLAEAAALPAAAEVRAARVVYFRVGDRFSVTNQWHEQTTKAHGTVHATLTILKALGGGKYSAKYRETTGKTNTAIFTLGAGGHFTFTERGVNEAGSGSGVFSKDGRTFTASATWHGLGAAASLKGSSTYAASRA